MQTITMDHELTTMAFDDCFGNRQTKTCATRITLPCAINTEKPIKNMGDLSRLNTDSGVLYRDE
jgi:hypothetical protein